MIVKVPAAARTPQSSPEAETVRVMMAEMGLAATDVRVLASNNSTHENMKQKNAVTPIPDAIMGENIFTKNLGNE